MALKGYIEGYYGRLLTWDQRSLILRKLNELNMDFYIYGPKEDVYHRIKWFEQYKDKELANFENFNENCETNGISFYYAISPGLSYGDDPKSNFNLLTSKISNFLDRGLKNFAIFLDDLENEKDEKLGELHANLIHEFSNYLEKNHGTSFVFCPTIYCERFAKKGIENSGYLKVLSERVPNSVSVMWTGKEVISKEITSNDVSKFKSVLNNPVIIWDNYYANDYCQNKFFVGPYRGREFSKDIIKGCGLNATGMPITDSIILSQFKGESTTEEIFQEFEVPPEFIEIFHFFDGPFEFNSSIETIKKLKNVQNIFQKICVDWKSELQLEWAPFLWQFFKDLHFLENYSKMKKEKVLKEWAGQRYSEPLLNILLKGKNK